MRITRRFVLALLLMSLVACTRYARDPDLSVARDFIINYYMLADQNLAMPYTTGEAKKQLENEIKLLETVVDRNNDHRSRDVTFELKSEKKMETQVNYLFNLKIQIPGLEAHTQPVSINVDLQQHKVSSFDNLQK